MNATCIALKPKIQTGIHTWCQGTYEQQYGKNCTKFKFQRKQKFHHNFSVATQKIFVLLHVKPAHILECDPSTHAKWLLFKCRGGLKNLRALLCWGGGIRKMWGNVLDFHPPQICQIQARVHLG